MIGETILVGTVPVDDVLVEPGARRDSDAIETPAGSTVEYTLRMPIGSERIAPGSKVTVRGHVLDLLACGDHWQPAERFGSWHGRWDMTAVVGRTLGDMTPVISVVSLTTSIDSLGDPTTVETVVYTGAAQARMESGATAGGTNAITEATESWWFVAPWQSAFETLRPQFTRIDYDGARYDVQSIEDIDEKSEFASFRAVRHG